MPRACVLLRHSASYRADAFRTGLKRHGFTIEDKWLRHPEPDDLVLLWNRTRAFEPVAEAYERRNAGVLIAENGFLGPADNARKMYALAWNHHNGCGAWYVGDEQRREFATEPWRTRDGHILLLPQRGIGEKGVAMPQTWLVDIQKRLRAVTDRPIKVRRHPGADRSDPWPDLKAAYCAVTWGSGAGLKAICHGVPVFHELKKWIGSPAAKFGIAEIDNCVRPDRGPMLHRISWAQWDAEEIESGKAFEYLLWHRSSSISRQATPDRNLSGKPCRLASTG